MKKLNAAENLGKYHLGTLTIMDLFSLYDDIYLLWFLAKDIFCQKNILYFWIHWTSAVVEDGSVLYV